MTLTDTTGASGVHLKSGPLKVGLGNPTPNPDPNPKPKPNPNPNPNPNLNSGPLKVGLGNPTPNPRPDPHANPTYPYPDQVGLDAAAVATAAAAAAAFDAAAAAAAVAASPEADATDAAAAAAAALFAAEKNEEAEAADAANRAVTPLAIEVRRCPVRTDKLCADVSNAAQTSPPSESSKVALGSFGTTSPPRVARFAAYDPLGRDLGYGAGDRFEIEFDMATTRARDAGGRAYLDTLFAFTSMEQALTPTLTLALTVP